MTHSAFHAGSNTPRRTPITLPDGRDRHQQPVVTGAPDDCFAESSGSRLTIELATSRCRELCSSRWGDAQIAIVGLDRGDDRFGRPGAT